MVVYHHILRKLNQFIKKYYTQKLLKGVLLFLALGGLFFLITLGVEYALWLSGTGRLLLFLFFVLMLGLLTVVHILVPLFQLFRLRRGIGPKDAAKMIGTHFPEVGDKLFNLLDLAENKERSELLLASMEQRSQQLRPIPFSKAIDYRAALGNAKYLVLPLLVAGLVWASGQWSSFMGSYERVVNYDVAYERPAPFSFQLLSADLKTLESEPYTLEVRTEGELRPENVFLSIHGKELLLAEENGVYRHTLSPPIRSTTFRFRGNDVRSREYVLTALKPPAILDFALTLTYPSYLNKPQEVINSTGNAILPEGTKVRWNILGKDAEDIDLITKDTTESFQKTGDAFSLERSVYSNLDYTISTSSAEVRDHERLDYGFSVVKDAYPVIAATQVLDSLNPNVSYYQGEASDDHGVAKIDLVHYPQGDEAAAERISLLSPNGNFAPFYYTYPSGLTIVPGRDYEFYFEVTDNDGIRGGKTTKSARYTHTILDGDALKNRDLETQESLIQNLDRSLERAKEQEERLEKLTKEQKEKSSLNFSDKSQVRDFLQKQEQQEAMMEKFSKELKDNLSKEERSNALNELLQERLERQEMEAKKNQKLLEELNKLADKINKDELGKRLEELAKQQQNSKRSLEQILELTKRYYVTEKAAQLSRELEKLSQEQEQLPQQQNENGTEAQQELNKAFDKISKDLDELKKDDGALKKPIGLKIDKDTKEGVQQDQQEALDALKKQEDAQGGSPDDPKDKAKKKQQSAAQKMKEMSEALSSSSAGGASGSSVAEDAEMLRQILDNLILFSFKQEALFDALSQREEQDLNQYSRTVRDQNELRNLFEHVDDSLFALSLRQAELSEFVNEQVTEVYYNIDKSLESMADGQMYQGVSHQKYVLNASNGLADFLADVLENMQQSMQMGQGSGGGFKLPDIIISQGQLKEKMGQQGQQGKAGQEGSQGKEGEGASEGQKGQDGMSGADGKKRGDGQSGEGSEGEQGQNGEGADGEGKGQGSAGSGELALQELYEIYQEQQRIRQALEEQLKDLINAEDRNLGEKLLQQMEDFENDLLENGITERTRNKMNTISHQLMQLENATLKQGEKKERESNTNLRDFSNPIITKPSLLQNYKNEVEVLNRQALPLRQNFKNRVKAYFKEQ
ncbi:hypothetical protein [Maribacter sp. 2307ULW6-5]|uniref:hypothetical protein n=1 Tax=Maribacter sp. 2307ULW6-5 TaxID=3386275 RepID=UPI0039BD0321